MLRSPEKGTKKSTHMPGGVRGAAAELGIVVAAGGENRSVTAADVEMVVPAGGMAVRETATETVVATVVLRGII
jgi:hypothetical protein